MKFDPLTSLSKIAQSDPAIEWQSASVLLVADPLQCRSILRNEQKNFVEHSDFYLTGSGYFEDRDGQLAIGREARNLLADAWSQADIDKHLTILEHGQSWPGTACQILSDIFLPALVRQERTQQIRQVLNEIIRVRMIERPHQIMGRIKSRLRRKRLIQAMHMEQKFADPNAVGQVDALDIVNKYCSECDDLMRAEIFLGLIFSAINSIGVSLSWIVRLSIINGKVDHAPEQLVNEGLRLYPISWLMERRPSKEHKIFDETIGPEHKIVVSPFAAHRVAKYWVEPENFHPARWTRQTDKTAWFPFGAGPHSCPAMSLNLEVLTVLTHKILTYAPWKITSVNDKINYGPALSPPTFFLSRKADG